MSSAFSIRLAKADDVPRILVLAGAISEAPHWSEAVYRGYVEPDTETLQRRVLLTAEEDGCLYGFAAITALEAEAELESIAVAEAVRRRGCGSVLLEAAMDWAATEGAEIMRLEVRARNLRAQAFYTSKEFEQVGLRKSYYRDPMEDGVLMQRNLERAHEGGWSRAGDL